LSYGLKISTIIRGKRKKNLDPLFYIKIFRTT
jgi:hypothetical protein